MKYNKFSYNIQRKKEWSIKVVNLILDTGCTCAPADKLLLFGKRICLTLTKQKYQKVKLVMKRK